MTTEPESENFHFLEDHPDEDGDKFLKRRLSYMLDQFSYQRLSGCSVEELNNQIEYYNLVLKDTYKNFTNSDFDFAEDPEMYEFIAGEELDLHEPLTSAQRMQIASVASKINANFDKAREDARDKKYERLSLIMDSIPVLNRLKRQS
ncbi:hypothetical protein [Natrinema amylolyticum]|uniref:hypothetical protein n=1 Tax=Natrinema amylolyticum TaxID=2878679 RepID=UPI001CFA1260|nr:hypothetical protein [Natrinema amylolyticum]